MHPDVSVIIPAHNAQRTLAAAIESALRQEQAVLEVVVVDDGSTDETPRIAARFNRVRCVRQPQAGPAAARNRGAAEAQGRFLAFLDADDLWLPGKLRRQVVVLDAQADAVAVQTGAYAVDDRLQVVEVRRCNPHRDRLIDFLLLRNLPAFSSSVMIRADAFSAAGGFATDLPMETWDMACRLARAGRLCGIADCLVLYRQHAANRSRRVEAHLETGLKALARFFADPSLDAHLRAQERRVWARFYAMLAGGHLRNHAWGECTRWACKAVATSPSAAPYVLGMPWRRLTRALSLPRHLSFAEAFPYALSAGGSAP